MKLNAIFSASLITIASLALTLPARADSVKAHCTYYVNGSNKAKASMPCRFYQAQGHIVLTWKDGVVSDFMPEKGRSMVYRDQYGGMVYRELGDDGLNIFKMEEGTIYTTFD